MANVNNPKGFKFVRSDIGSGAVPTARLKLGSNVGVKIGDMVYIASGVGQRTTNTQASFGIAIETVTAAAGIQTQCLVIPFQGQVLGKLSCTEATLRGVSKRVSGASGAMGIASVAGTTVAACPIHIIGLAGTPHGNAWSTNAVLEFTIQKNQYTGQA
jgi:hypothetical protein